MSLDALRSYTHFSKYSIFDHDLGRKETKRDAAARMFGMHRMKYEDIPEVMPLIDEAEKAFLDDEILGSQRALQYGGIPALKKNARVYNCTVSYCDRPRFFQEAFWLLLCGCGTGFSMQRHHVGNLPSIAMPRGNGSTITFTVPDTIEGWADAAGMLLSSYLEGDNVPFPEAQGRWVDFDFSQIRPEGSPLSSGAGKAPGPGPLRDALEAARGVLTLAAQQGTHLRPIHTYDIMMHLSDAVLAGGVRRSASICLFSHDDEEMMMAKAAPNWHVDNPQRQNSNNSAMLLRGSITREEFHRIKETTKLWGEPGFVWTDSLELLVNPCVEIGMWAKALARDVWQDSPMSLKEGEELISGWQFCNLSVVNVARCFTEEDFILACRRAAIIGTLQAGYTKFHYLEKASEFITEREALLGVSMTGMMDNPHIAFDYDLQRRGAKTVLDTNEMVANLIGINPAARATCIKPEGTSSCFLGTASGIHAHPSRRFIRNVTAKKNEPVAQFFAEVNPHAAEVSQRSSENMILSFLVELPENALTKDHVGSMDLLERVRQTRLAWVEHGRRPERCVKPWLSHNVSNTINLKDDEWDEAFDYVYDHRESFAGVAMLNHFGDLDYAQAPFQSVMSEMELEQAYGKYAVREARATNALAEHIYGELWTACNHVIMDPIPNEGSPHQTFVREVMQLAYDWTESNIKEATYLMKRVYLMDRWNLLQDTMKEVDYTLMKEDDGIKFETIAACAGGACEI